MHLIGLGTDSGNGFGTLQCNASFIHMIICRVHAPCSVRPPKYSPSSTNATFQYFPYNYTFDKAAELECNKADGHLASYSMLLEQRRGRWRSGTQAMATCCLSTRPFNGLASKPM
jgi:hypothetical protein